MVFIQFLFVRHATCDLFTGDFILSTVEVLGEQNWQIQNRFWGWFEKAKSLLEVARWSRGESLCGCLFSSPGSGLIE